MFGDKMLLKYTETGMCREEIKQGIKQFPVDLNQHSSLGECWRGGSRSKLFEGMFI